jgi:5-methyltetrahydropteroyltriglutamate--homocysteine methyltransferase
VRARHRGVAIDEDAYEKYLSEAVADVVRRQAQAGVDTVDDGEFGKSVSWSMYVLQRLSGFEQRQFRPGKDSFARGADRERFREFYEELDSASGNQWAKPITQDTVCVGPIKYIGINKVQRDIDNLKAALQTADVEEAFLPVAAPPALFPAGRTNTIALTRNCSSRSPKRSEPNTEPSAIPESCCRWMTRAPQ